MNTIARNAIYAATVFTLWPSALYANTYFDDTTFDCPPLLAPVFKQNARDMPGDLPNKVPSNLSGKNVLVAPEPVISSQPGVAFQMNAGRLKPQLERILRQHLAVQHIVWQVAEEYEWPSSYLLEAKSWSALVESLLGSYQLRLQLFANHSAVISYPATTANASRGGL